MTLRRTALLAVVVLAVLGGACASSQGGGGGGMAGFPEDDCFGSGAALYPPAYAAGYPGGYGSSYYAPTDVVPCGVYPSGYYPERSLEVARASVKPAQTRSHRPPTIDRGSFSSLGIGADASSLAGSSAPASAPRMDPVPVSAPPTSTTTVKRN